MVAAEDLDLRAIAVWKFQELFADKRTSKTRSTAQDAIEKEIDRLYLECRLPL